MHLAEQLSGRQSSATQKNPSRNLSGNLDKKTTNKKKTKPKQKNTTQE